MKNILVINGSARKDSVSTALCAAFIEGHESDINIKTYNAYKMNAKPCYGCGYCDKNKACVNKDLDEFMADFEAADYFIVSTPVFNGSVPSPLKAVVDRFQRYYALRFAHGVKPPIVKPKKAALIIAAGSKGDGKEAIENMFKQQFTVLNTTLESVIFVDSTDMAELTAEQIGNAKEAGSDFFEKFAMRNS